MSDFDKLYAAFIRTAQAKTAIQEIKNIHPEISAGAAAKAAKNMAEIAYNLGMESYFDPDAKEGIVSKNWHEHVRKLKHLPPQHLSALVKYSEAFADNIMPEAQNSREEALFRAVFGLSAKAMATYAPEKLEDPKLQKLMMLSCEQILNPDNGFSTAQKFPLALKTFSGLYQDNSSAYFNRLKMIGKAIQKIDDPQKIDKVCDEIDMLYQNEGDLTPAMAEGFEKNVIPMVNKTPDFANLSAEHDCTYGEYGLMGYTNKILTSEWTPQRLNEALGILKEVPSPDMEKRERLRTKAIELEAAEFNGLRDFIHSETIGVNELITHMSDYHNAKKSGNKHASAQNAALIKEDLTNMQLEEFLPVYLDIKRYDKVINDDTGETAIEAIRTIASDMKKSNNRPPVVGDKGLDDLSQKFTMDGRTDVQQFGQFMDVLNNKIIDHIDSKKVGISPEMVDLLYWCDQKSANILKSRDFEQQCGDHKSEWFKQIALFAELTNSAEQRFNRKGFEAYFKHVQSQDNFIDANNILIKRQRLNVFKLFDSSKETQQRVTGNLQKKLLSEGRASDAIDYESERLGKIFDNRRKRMISGNLVCEIFKLNDFKKPSTRIGERYAEEMAHKQLVERPAEKALLKLLKDHKGIGK